MARTGKIYEAQILDGMRVVLYTWPLGVPPPYIKGLSLYAFCPLPRRSKESARSLGWEGGGVEFQGSGPTLKPAMHNLSSLSAI